MKRFNVGTFMKETKAKKGKLLEGTEKIKELDEELKNIEDSLKKRREDVEAKKKEVRAKEEQLQRLNLKVSSIVDSLEELDEIKQGCMQEVMKGVISEKAAERRRKNKTEFCDTSASGLKGCISQVNKRRAETFQAAVQVHGASDVDSSPAEIGLIDTSLQKCSKDILIKAISKNKKLKKDVTICKKYKEDIAVFESSEDNMIRSVGVYYNGGVMGKNKYRKIYRDSSYKPNNNSHINSKTVRIAISNLPVPRLVPYNKLMPFINSIPIGTIYSVHDTLCYDMPEEEKVSGVYRCLKETLLKLANFYLSGHSNHELIWFDEGYTFYFTLGGDGAPFGKDDCSCSWLIGFLNIGKGILSSNENFLIFGANCSENSLPVRRYINILLNDITSIEKSVFSLDYKGSSVEVKFRVGELPNDMKMLAFLSGELSNSATFFSSFADVSVKTAKTLDGTFGKEKKNTWKPWKYTERLKVAKDVQDLKEKMSKEKLKPSTQRSKITTSIANANSRQEFPPLIGKLVDRIHVDPLHLKNNACALAQRHLLDLVLELSNIPPSVTSFSQVNCNSPLAKYVSAMRQNGLSRLGKQLVRWFNNNRHSDKGFEYRFTGRDSRGLLHKFMYLIDAIEPYVNKGEYNEVLLYVIACHCKILRDCVSLFNRLDISDDQITKLQQLCKQYHYLNLMYFGHHPTAWTLAHIVPAHVREMKDKYGKGLGLNSMEGREAKHIFIAKYCINTNYHLRWSQIFRHEYISLLWLRERKYNILKPTNSSSLSYIPKQATADPNYCYCGFPKSSDCLKCKFCINPLMDKILESLATGKRHTCKR